jgi:hypothetical protein
MRFHIVNALVVAGFAAMACPEISSPQARSAPQIGLPRVTKMRICRVASRSTATKAIEFIIETDGEVPVRSYGPALFVGDVEINQSERIRATTWRLLALDPERLKPGTFIYWGWMKARPDERINTRFRYEVERDARICASPP